MLSLRKMFSIFINLLFKATYNNVFNQSVKYVFKNWDLSGPIHKQEQQEKTATTIDDPQQQNLSQTIINTRDRECITTNKWLRGKAS